MYKILNNTITGELNCIKRLSDGAFIPIDQECIDYQAYLAWLAEGNVPEPSEVTE